VNFTGIAQALTNKKLLITYLNDAKEILVKIKERVEKLRGAKETKFQLYFYLSRINYYLGVPDETRNFFTKKTTADGSSTVGCIGNLQNLKKRQRCKLIPGFSQFFLTETEIMADLVYHDPANPLL